jgi:hypothetical protein
MNRFIEFAKYVIYRIFAHNKYSTVQAFYLFIYFCDTGVWTPGLHLESLHQALFCAGIFQDSVLWTTCLRHRHPGCTSFFRKLLFYFILFFVGVVFELWTLLLPSRCSRTGALLLEPCLQSILVWLLEFGVWRTIYLGWSRTIVLLISAPR